MPQMQSAPCNRRVRYAMQRNTKATLHKPLPASVLDATFVMQGDGHIDNASDALTLLLGYPSGETVSQLSDLIADVQDASQILDWLQAGASFSTLQLHTSLLCSQGDQIPALLWVSAVRNAGQVTAYCTVKEAADSAYQGSPAVMHDVCELVLARTRLSQMLLSQESMLAELRTKQAALEESEFRWKFAIEGAGEGVWDWDIKTDITSFSPRWKEILGYAAEEILPHHKEWHSRIHPQDAGNVNAALSQYLKGETPMYSAEFRMRTKGGAYIWIASRGVCVSRDSDGNPTRIIGTHKNIDNRVKARLRLEQSEQRLRAITDNTTTLMFMKDLGGRYLYMNKAFETLFNLSNEADCGKTDFDFFPHEMAQDFRANDDWVATTGKALETVEHAPHVDGVHTYASVKVPVRDEHGALYAICGMATDITERERMEKEILIAAAAFESPLSMMVTDENQRIQKVNQAFVDSTGYSAQYAIGRTPRFLKSGKNNSAFYAAMWKSITDTGSWEGEIWGRRRSGEFYPKWLSISTVRDDSGKVTHYVSSDSDISERKQAEVTLQQLNQALEEKKQQLRELVAQNEAIRERERKHIAREVHDELGQVLTALRMDTSFIAMRFGDLAPALNEKVLHMRTLVDSAIQGVRNVASNLRPVALDMGIYLALDWLCQDFTKHTGVDCVLHALDQSVMLDEARSVGIFRIVQESLTNISRYAQASQVRVLLGLQEGVLGVEIQDNGRGFDPVLADKGKTFGLLGMRERALALGGSLDVISSVGAGTTIGLTIPMERRHPDEATR